MASFSIVGGGSTTFTDTTPNGGVVIDFSQLDNGFSVQINGVDLFVGGPPAAPNELEFQQNSTPGRTVRFADGTIYGSGGQDEIWELNEDGASSDPIVRLAINPDGTIELLGAKTVGGPLEPLELINGLSVNSADVAAAWNDSGDNTIVIDQTITGPTNAIGTFDDVICFAAGTSIETRNGPVAVEKLRVGDEVLTHDNGYQPIRWTGSTKVSAARLGAEPRLRPILIRADALGPGYPASDLIVSPQHRVLVASAIARRMFGQDAVLVPANKLTCLDGIDIIDDDLSGGVTYVHFICDAHEVVWANGAPAESLFVGPQALGAVSDAAREELRALFPAMSSPDFIPVSARFIPEKGRQMRKLAERHRTNRKPLYSGGAVGRQH